MNSEEAKAARRIHRTTSDRWAARSKAKALKAGAIGKRIDEILKAPTGEVRRARLLRPLLRANASLLGSCLRAEWVADRHARHAQPPSVA